MFGDNEQFTVEEVNLMCIYDTSSRVRRAYARPAITAGLTEAIYGFEDNELIEIAQSALSKLSKISDADFAALGFYPEYDYYYEFDESEV
jgi:hypothetical protein